MSKNLFVSSKKIFLSFFLSFIGVFLFIFSPNDSNNIWQSLIELFTDRWFIITQFLSISFFVFELYNVTNNTNVILRSESLRKYILNNAKHIIKMVLINLFMAVVIFIVGSVMIKVCNLSNVNYEYSIPAWFYFLFLFIKSVFLLSLISILLYFIEWNFGKIGTIFSNFLIIFLMFINVDIFDPNVINDLSEIPLLFTSYFKLLKFSNFLLEISANIIQISFLVIVNLVIFKIFFVENQEKKIK